MQNKIKSDTSMEFERRYQVQLFINSGITDTNVIAGLTGHSSRTIRNIKKRLKERGTIERKAGSGRPQKLNGIDKQRVSQITHCHPKWSRQLIANYAAQRGSPLVSRWTIGCYLKGSGWLKLIPKLKP